jgi:hypothetical protein
MSFTPDGCGNKRLFEHLNRHSKRTNPSLKMEDGGSLLDFNDCSPRAFGHMAVSSLDGTTVNGVRGEGVESLNTQEQTISTIVYHGLKDHYCATLNKNHTGKREWIKLCSFVEFACVFTPNLSVIRDRLSTEPSLCSDTFLTVDEFRFHYTKFLCMYDR